MLCNFFCKEKMIPIEAKELIPTERVAIVVWLLRDGKRLSTADVAGAVSLSHDGAYKMLLQLAAAPRLLTADC